MKKILSSALMLFLAFSLSAAVIDNVYRNSVSSESFAGLPERGTVFTDGGDNILFVKSVNGNTVLFDKFYTKTKPEVGSFLNERKYLIKTGVSVSARMAMAECSFVLKKIYPLEPYVAAGYSFKGGINAMAGMRLSCPLSNLVSSSFTILENGAIEGYAAMGLANGSYLGFNYGVGYKHTVGRFQWGVGLAWNQISGEVSGGALASASAGVYF